MKEKHYIYIYIYIYIYRERERERESVQVSQQIAERTIMHFANADTQPHFSRGLTQFRFAHVNLNIFHDTKIQIY